MERFVQRWGQQVRDEVDRLALLPERPTVPAIYAALIAGATGQGGALGASDIPPQATVARWVWQIRKDATDAVTGNPAQLETIAARLTEKLRQRTTAARTPAEITACAKAARELTALHRDMSRPAPANRRPKPRDPSPAPPGPTEPLGDEGSSEDAFLRTLAESDADA